MKTSTIKKIFFAILITAIWVSVWQGIYVFVDNPLFVESPYNVAVRFLELASQFVFWKTVFLSVSNILVGFILGVLFGTVMAFISINNFFDKLLAPLKIIIRATPVASFIMLTWIWLKRSDIPIFISFLMVTPIVWGNVSTGIKNIKKEYIELAYVYKFSKIKKLKSIYLPSVLPYFATSVCTSSGLVWKAGIAAEVLCQPQGTIGANLFEAKGFLETLDVFVWTGVVIIISIILEMLIKMALKKLERRFKFVGLT